MCTCVLSITRYNMGGRDCKGKTALLTADELRLKEVGQLLCEEGAGTRCVTSLRYTHTKHVAVALGVWVRGAIISSF